MSTPFYGQVTMFSFMFAPKDWSNCEGQLLPINSNQALFSLLGNTFGGDARTTFGLPDLRGRVPVGVSGNVQYAQGNRFGLETVTLTNAETGHHHNLMYNSVDEGDIFFPYTASTGGHQLANVPATRAEFYTSNPGTTQQLSAGAVTTAGGSQSHYNVQPSIVLRYCIALDGIYPPRN